MEGMEGGEGEDGVEGVMNGGHIRERGKGMREGEREKVGEVEGRARGKEKNVERWRGEKEGRRERWGGGRFRTEGMEGRRGVRMGD